jgi:hypothetical protein
MILPILSLAITITAISAQSSPLNQTLTETANLMTSQVTMIYARDQQLACAAVKNPVGYTTCGAAITDTSAQCCYISKAGAAGQCVPVATSYPELYKHILTNQGNQIDCPLLSNSTVGAYKDELHSNLITQAEAQIVIDSSLAVKDITPTDIERCTNVANPSSVDICSGAYSSSKAKCCLHKGSNGKTSLNFCNTIPNDAISIMTKLEGVMGVTVTCNAGYFGFTLLMSLIYISLLL